MTNEEVALLVTKLQNGDESAFDTLFTVYKNTAVRTAALITGDFSLAAKGFYIEDGIKTHPVEQITVAGNFFTLLNNIEEIGSDLKFPMSSVGSPSNVIKEHSNAGEGAKNE